MCLLEAIGRDQEPCCLESLLGYPGGGVVCFALAIAVGVGLPHLRHDTTQRCPDNGLFLGLGRKRRPAFFWHLPLPTTIWLFFIPILRYSGGGRGEGGILRLRHSCSKRSTRYSRGIYKIYIRRRSILSLSQGPHCKKGRQHGSLQTYCWVFICRTEREDIFFPGTYTHT